MRSAGGGSCQPGRWLRRKSGRGGTGAPRGPVPAPAQPPGRPAGLEGSRHPSVPSAPRTPAREQRLSAGPPPASVTGSGARAPPEALRTGSALLGCGLGLGGTLGDTPGQRDSPMMEMGLRAKRSRPHTPTYLLRQPADQRRTTYSVPKNTTSTISCGERGREPRRRRPPLPRGPQPHQGLPGRPPAEGARPHRPGPRRPGGGGGVPAGLGGSGSGGGPGPGPPSPGSRGRHGRGLGAAGRANGVKGHHGPWPRRRGQVTAGCACHGETPPLPGLRRGCAPASLKPGPGRSEG